MTHKIFLLGSTDFTLTIADAIRETGAEIGAVAHVGQEFRISYSKGGVKNYRSADIAGWCAAHGVEAIPYTDIAGLGRAIEGHGYALAVLAGWYHMVPSAFRARFDRGCVGFHASLLPRLRGGAPLNWAILSGLTETGLSLFEVGDGVDDGPIYDQQRFAIDPRARIRDLVEMTAEAGSAMVRRSLPGILSGQIRARPQTGEPSYCLQRSPEDGRIDWRMPASDIDRLIRAVSRPYPGGLTKLDGQEFAIHAAEPMDDLKLSGAPGQIANLPDHAWPIVVCGQGSLALTDAETSDGIDAMPLLRRASNKRLS